MKYRTVILCPGGNNQMLVQGIAPKEKKKLINDQMIKLFPSVEQVSFYQYDKMSKFAKLELAGGEFCGNATRSLAYLLLDGKIGKLKIQVSGTTTLLTAGIKQKDTAFAQMPIYKNLKSVKQIKKTLFQVDLQGITHLVSTDEFSVKKEILKKIAWNILEKENLLYTKPAAGVMFVREKANQTYINPVVWVRDINTLLYETACASGTTAVGLWYSVVKNADSLNLPIIQPSGKKIYITIRKNSKEFINAVIDGPIEVINQTIIEI